MKHPVIEQVKEAIRHPFDYGYPYYVVLSDGERLCRQCSRENFALRVDATRNRLGMDWEAIGAEVYWEGPNEICANCYKELPSAYGDPDGEGEQTDAL